LFLTSNKQLDRFSANCFYPKIVDNCQELRQLYLLKEEFRNIFEKINDREKAENFLFALKRKCLATGNRYLIKFVGTLENW
jgi:transposase